MSHGTCFRRNAKKFHKTRYYVSAKNDYNILFFALKKPVCFNREFLLLFLFVFFADEETDTNSATRIYNRKIGELNLE
jgi:hypothetical protein